MRAVNFTAPSVMLTVVYDPSQGESLVTPEPGVFILIQVKCNAYKQLFDLL